MIAPPKSVLARIFEDLIRDSRHTGQMCRMGLAGGAQLVVLVAEGYVTVTIKRRGVPVGAVELATFRRHCRIPDDAETLTPPEQGTREIPVEAHDPEAGSIFTRETWYYVTLRWQEEG